MIQLLVVLFWAWTGLFAALTLAGILIGDPFPLRYYQPLAVPVLLYMGARKLAAVPAKRRATREARAEEDYRETLALIDWKPKTRTAADEIEEALELERPEC